MRSFGVRFRVWSVLTGFIFVLNFVGFSAFAEEVILADFDDTIVESRPEMDGGFVAKYILYLNPYRANTIQEVPQGEEKLVISTYDYRRLRNLLSYGQHTPGSLKPFELSDGRVIVPGNYQVLFDQSFQFFRPSGVKAQSHLVDQFTDTFSIRGKSNSWQGLYWESMRKILSTERGAKAFRILTSRGHESWEWDALFNLFLEKKWVSHLPNSSQFHNVARREYDSITVRFDDISLKVNLIEKAARALNDRSLSSEDLRLAADGVSQKQLHTLVFVEDNPDIVEAAFQKFKALALSRRFPIKYVLINTGTDEEVRLSRRPRSLVLKEDGGFRLAAEEEITGEVVKKAKASDVPKYVPGCENLLRLLSA